MKILYYSPHPHLSLGASTGYATHMRELIAAFRLLGHTVHPVICGGTASGAVMELKQSRTKKMLRKLAGPFLWRSLKEMALVRRDRQSAEMLGQEILKFQPDLIYERSGFLLSSGSEMAQKYGIPHVVEVNAPFEEEVRAFEGAGSLLERKGRKKLQQVLQNARLVVTVSSVLRDFLCKHYGVKESSTIVTPNAINPDFIHPDTALKAEIETKWIRGKKPVVGFVGSVFPYHGVDLLIRAFASIDELRRNGLLLIVGDGYLIPELKQLAATLGCSESIQFTGSVPHNAVFSFIERMDITVMARSNWYGSPVKIFEYGAMGKPVIAPDTAPVRDVMVPGEHGVLIGSGADELKEALLSLLHDPGKTQRMADAFQQKVFVQHTWEQVARQVLNAAGKG